MSTEAAASRPVRRRRQTASCAEVPDLAALSGASLGAVRVHVLACLDALEGRLAEEPAAEWARDGLRLLRDIRADVRARLPSYDASRDAMLARLPDLPDLPGLADLPELPDLHVLERLSAALDAPGAYLPTLSEHLRSLQTHLASASAELELPGADVLDRLLATLAPEDGVLERAARDLTRAVKASMNGARLIAYADLPHAWKNNHFVTSGYRFIPLDKWPLIILSLFMIHNETLNIHTHLIPMVHGLFRIAREATSGTDVPERLFMVFACLCLFTSATWHTMSGCADRRGMELCARADYVGIGWLISASVGTVVHYGFQEEPVPRAAYLALCLLMGLTGSVLPFMAWFNQRRYKLYRVAFFVFLACAALAPLAHLAGTHGVARTLVFVAPILVSVRSYLVGLAFYVTHFPECACSGRWVRRFDALGGGSHAIWHVLIVVAIYQHKTGMRALRDGFA